MVKNLINIFDDIGKEMEVEVLTYFQLLSTNKTYLVYTEVGSEDSEEVMVGMLTSVKDYLGIYALSGRDLDQVKTMINDAIKENKKDDDAIILPITRMNKIETRTYSTIKLTEEELEKLKSSELGKVGVRKDNSGVNFEHNPHSKTVLNSIKKDTTSKPKKSVEKIKAEEKVVEEHIDPLISEPVIIPKTHLDAEIKLPSLTEIEKEVDPLMNKMSYEKELAEIIEVKEKIKPKKEEKQVKQFSRSFKRVFSAVFYILLLTGIFFFFETKINSIIPIKTKLSCTKTEEITNEQTVEIKDTFRFFGGFKKRYRTHDYKFESKALYYQYQDLIDNYEEDEKLPGSVLKKKFDNQTLIYHTSETIKLDQLSGSLKKEYNSKSYKAIREDLLKKGYTCN